MSYWAVVQTESQREPFVRMMLMREGYETYLPRIRMRKRILPLFPSYLFVRIVDRWYPVKNTIGVSKVLLAGDQPAHVHDAIIVKIKHMEHGGIVRLPKPEKTLKPGAKVQIVRGHFQGHIGIYDGASGKERERVLLQLLGQSVPVNVPAADITPLRIAQ